MGYIDGLEKQNEELQQMLADALLLLKSWEYSGPRWSLVYYLMVDSKMRFCTDYKLNDKVFAKVDVMQGCTKYHATVFYSEILSEDTLFDTIEEAKIFVEKIYVNNLIDLYTNKRYDE